ncbi:MAG: SDR family NAD(P)-dependent oxidoreductase [Roseiflexaceae bacterium]|nr:SDR family NAD(P)-dependent oxidoreductase [Roseiflexaceae bacterium]
MKIAQRKIIITGAASGIGRALLVRLAAYPCQIVAADRDAAGLAAAVAQSVGRATIFSFVGDLAQPAEIDRLLAYARAQIGGCDLCFANAGFAYYEQSGQADWQHMQRLFELNTFAPIYMALRLRELDPERPYRVVITASAMAKFGVPGYALYAASKAALDRFAEVYRYELAPNGRIALVYPISTRTNFFRAANASTPPIPWPSQSAEQVATAVIRGVERGQDAIYPSRLFWWAWKISGIFPPLRIAYQRTQRRALKRWAQQRERF